VPANGAQKPLELILARNLLTSISTPAFLVDEDARLLFYNEAAGALLGRSFEEAGQMSAGEWTSAFGPLGDHHDPIPVEELPLTGALRDGRPAHGRFCIRSSDGVEREIEASAFPLVGADSAESGAMILWWPRAAGEADRG
jgi:PAS domain-containing protein